MRTEKEFLNTLDTYIKVTIDRLKDGRIIDAHEELTVMLKMTEQRVAEVEGKAPWAQKANELGEEMLSAPRTKEN